MPSDSFLHERNDFNALVETVADSEKINDPALVEKDYWIMHAVFGLKQLGLTFFMHRSIGVAFRCARSRHASQHCCLTVLNFTVRCSAIG
jgi:hypothetical protein